jgi:hypothetical protein
MNSLVIKGANATPTIIVDENHWRFPPFALSNNAPLQNSRNNIMAVPENIRFNDEIFTHDSFDRIAAAID